MAARTILYAGKGGVGKTSVAAATARLCAKQGARTLVVSTDAAHSLSEALATEIGDEPAKIAANLWAHQIEHHHELERNWSSVQAWLGESLASEGVQRAIADEMAVPPGAEEIFNLFALKGHIESSKWDVVIVDCAASGETLRLLAFPEVAHRWLTKVVGADGGRLATMRPLASRLLDISLPSESVVDQLQAALAGLTELNSLLRADQTSIRLVLTPDRVVVAEAMRTFTYLTLYGYRTDAVVVNRVFPDELADTYFQSWLELQRQQLVRLDEAFAPIPILRADYMDTEVAGPEMLDRLGAVLFAGIDPSDVLHRSSKPEIQIAQGGRALHVSLPFANKGDISVKRVGRELTLSLNGHSRRIVLPDRIARLPTDGARFEHDTLVVTFGTNTDDDR